MTNIQIAIKANSQLALACGIGDRTLSRDGNIFLVAWQTDLHMSMPSLPFLKVVGRGANIDLSSFAFKFSHFVAEYLRINRNVNYKIIGRRLNSAQRWLKTVSERYDVHSSHSIKGWATAAQQDQKALPISLLGL